MAIGGTGIWVTHVVAMLGYTIPGQEILYNVPMTVISLEVAVSVVAAGLFVADLGRGGLRLGAGRRRDGQVRRTGDQPAPLPLLLGASVVTFLLMLAIAMSPNEDEILADASLTQRVRAGASLTVRLSGVREAEVTQPDVFETGSRRGLSRRYGGG